MTETSETDIPPPHSLDDEAACIGSVMLCDDPTQQRRLRAMLSRDDFFHPDHAAIFDCVGSLIDADKPVDTVTVRAALRDRGVLEEVGGVQHLAKIIGTVPTWRHGEHYARRVQGMAIRRQAIKRCESLAERLHQPAELEHAEQTVQRCISDLWRLLTRRSRVQVFSMESMLLTWIERRQEKGPPCLLSGIDVLDEFAGIFALGGYTILAGRPSMGKSTFLRWLLGQWAAAGTPVGLVACEEDQNKIAGNYLSAETGMENDAVAYRDLGQGQWNQIMDATAGLAQRPWFGVDSAFTLNEVSTAIEMLVMEHSCKVIGVDHLHLIRLEQRMENEQREIKEVSRRLKELAKQHGVVLIAAAQLSRPAEKVAVPKPPTLTDLRASGAIEEHADAVLLLHREDYYRPRETATRECDVIVAKNRNGKRGTCVLTAELERQRFSVPRHLQRVHAPAAQSHFDPFGDPND